MSRIITQGECLIDIVFEQGQPLYAVAGGSMLNTALSLGRAGVPVEFIGEYSEDAMGQLLTKVLNENNVGHQWSLINLHGQTSLAIATLDEAKNATYDFYHIPVSGKQEFPIPAFNEGDLFLFGSGFALKEEKSHWLDTGLSNAKQAQCLVYYDLNIRKNHLDELQDIKGRVHQNMSHSSIVKGSDEDFYNIYDTWDSELVYQKVNSLCPILIISAGSKNLTLFTPKGSLTFVVPQIEPVSTIGAGDNLNAGVLYALYKLNILPAQLQNLEDDIWEYVMNTGIQFATACCLNTENYIPKNFTPGNTIKDKE